MFTVEDTENVRPFVPCTRSTLSNVEVTIIITPILEYGNVVLAQS